ncbi:hypothetical protein BH18CHL2_BH18CHL2_12920 [soil metagenome]
MTGTDDRLSLRGGLLGFVLMSGLVVAAALGLLVLIDPRTQAYWGERLGDVLAAARSVIGR